MINIKIYNFLNILSNKIAYQTYQKPLLTMKNLSGKSHISKISQLSPLISSPSNRTILKCYFLILFQEYYVEQNVSNIQLSSYEEHF